MVKLSPISLPADFSAARLLRAYRVSLLVSGINVAVIQSLYDYKHTISNLVVLSSRQRWKK